MCLSGPDRGDRGAAGCRAGRKDPQVTRGLQIPAAEALRQAWGALCWHWGCQMLSQLVTLGARGEG